MKKSRSIPFDFVLEKLYTLNPLVRPMFGCHALYVQGKIVLMLRKKENDTDDNGVWIATIKDYHESLKKDLPSMRSIKLFGKRATAWQVLPEDSDDFEQSVMKACDLILRFDHRIGKVPKQKSGKKKG